MAKKNQPDANQSASDHVADHTGDQNRDKEHGHDHGKAQGHGHGHDHVHGASASRNRLAWALTLALSVVSIQFIGAAITGSLALAADGAHGIADSFGLVIALIAAVLLTKPRSDRRTWGFARAEVLAAGLQAGLLIALCIWIIYEAIHRFLNPAEIIAGPMLWIGVLGLTANIAAMAILMGGRNDSLNMKAAFLEVTSDALGSVAVIAAALITLATGWMYADSVASLLIAIMIGVRATAILRKSVRILLEETPEGIDLADVRKLMLANPYVVDVHDLHASSIGTGLGVLTAHVVVTKECVDQGKTVKVLHDLQEELTRDYPELNHATIQIDHQKHAAHEELAHSS